MPSKVHATAAQVSDAFGSWAVLGDLHRQAPEGGVSRQSCQFMFFFRGSFQCGFWTSYVYACAESESVVISDHGHGHGGFVTCRPGFYRWCSSHVAHSPLLQVNARAPTGYFIPSAVECAKCTLRELQMIKEEIELETHLEEGRGWIWRPG